MTTRRANIGAWLLAAAIAAAVVVAVLIGMPV